MKLLCLTISLTALSLLVPAEAKACRVAPRPDSLRMIQAEAVVLVRVTSVDIQGDSWRATAVAQGVLAGRARPATFNFAGGPAANNGVVSCGARFAPPRVGRYHVLYLQDSDGLLPPAGAYPYWWARQSGDPRLARLDRLLPLGAAREATRDEARLLDLVEARIPDRAGVRGIRRYTRVYARSSDTLVGARVLRSGRPRRLVVDSSEELPTRESCGCALIEFWVDLEDLRATGQLPPFDP